MNVNKEVGKKAESIAMTKQFHVEKHSCFVGCVIVS